MLSIGAAEDGYDEDGGLVSTAPSKLQARAVGVAYRSENTDVKSFCSFVPPHWVTYWADASGRRYITVAFALPSGLAKKGKLTDKVKSQVSNDGMSLMVSCEWPSMLFDVDEMVHEWNLETRKSLNTARKIPCIPHSFNS